MKEDYHKWYSQWIGEDFEMLVFGEEGTPLILFPPAESRYFDYKDFGVIESLSHCIEEGRIKVYCPDSFDTHCWQNYDLDPQQRVENYLAFEKTILQDVLGFANFETEESKYIFSGFQRGGYYALNLAYKYPDLSAGLITIGGEFDIKKYIQGYFDENAYFNSPMDYLFGLTEEGYLSKFKRFQTILAAGSLDNSFEENRYLSKLLFEKNINHLFDAHPYKLNTFEDCKSVLNDNLHYVL